MIQETYISAQGYQRLAEAYAVSGNYHHLPSRQMDVLDGSAGCERPVLMTRMISRDLFAGRTGEFQGSYIHAVACRKCAACRDRRRKMWTRRIDAEMLLAELRGDRSWFLTFTFWAGDEAGKNEEIATRRLTLYFKRLRKLQGRAGRLRYCAVREYHKSGRIHYHAVLHELGEPITKRLLERCRVGLFGHCRFVLASGKTSRYIAKYLSKDLSSGRIRASHHYGRSLCVWHPRVAPGQEWLLDARRAFAASLAASPRCQPRGTEQGAPTSPPPAHTRYTMEDSGQ